jgi:hypothetical protein
MDMSCHVPPTQAALSRERIPVPSEWEIVQAPQPVWVSLEKKNSLDSSGIRNSGLRNRMKIQSIVSTVYKNFIAFESEK